MPETIAEILEREAAEAEAAREAGVDVGPGARPRPARAPSEAFTVRIPLKHLTRLRRLAEERHTTPSALLRQFLLERLDAESLAHSPPAFVVPGMELSEELTGTLGEILNQLSVIYKVVVPTNYEVVKDTDWPSGRKRRESVD